MILKGDAPKALQIGFLVLLAASTAQVAWWIADQVRLANDHRDQMAALFDADATAVTAVLQALPDAIDDAAIAGVIRSLMPHLRIDAATAAVRPEARENLAAETTSRVNRYAWEGGFFLLVLLGGMAVITAAIRQEARLRRRQQDFLAAISHEFKSPLASMRLAAETLALRTADAASRRLGQRLLADGNRLLNMVDNLLDATRIEEDRLRLRHDKVPLAPQVQAACSAFADEASERGVDIHAAVAEDAELEGDPEAVETVLRNLLDNALKACSAGDGGTIHVSAERGDGTIALTVADDGVGFPPEDAERIFGKFYRSEPAPGSGTGLGLYIVARLAALSGATVAAHSAGHGRGARVTVTWPASP